MFIRNHSMVRMLISLRGNPRACVYTEPMWAIPFHLYMPFVSVYMAALMLSDRQIGIVASVFMLFRALGSFLSGALTDKLGRKRTTLIFDAISWSVPTLLWAFSQNFWWFIAAAMFNGMGEVTHNSWNCMLIEDADKSALVEIYAWVQISGLLAVFFAPLAGFLVGSLSIIPAMRIMYLFAFVSMTLKFIILYKYCDETQVGMQRLEQTRSMSIPALISGYGAVARKLFASPRMMTALLVVGVSSATTMITNTFFGLYATRNLLMPEYYLAYFPIIRSAIMLVFLFVIQPKIASFGMKGPMTAGVMLYIISYTLLIFLPAGNLWLLMLCIFLESCAIGLMWPRIFSIQALFIDPDERARLNSILSSVVFVAAIPFGYLSGWMSSIDGRLPFVAIIIIFAVQFVVVLVSRSLKTENVRAIEAMHIGDAP